MSGANPLFKPVIAARSLMKTFPSGRVSIRALRGVSVDIFPRQVTLLRGPSGSGKTTLLSAFGCILTPDSGDLHVGGEDVQGLNEQELSRTRLEKIGFVFQSFNLFPTLKAWENVAVALDLRGMPRRVAKERSLGVLGKVGLADRSESFPAELSGGQNQRVAIARALVGDPSIILADEPTAALDTENGRSVMELLRNLAVDEGRAVVIVTHDERAVEFSDRVLTMKDGTIISDFPASALRRVAAGQAQVGDQVERLRIGSDLHRAAV